MKQKRRGFTLIELLAVIVILAIIALIAVPVIMNIISEARKSAFKDTAYGIISAGEMYYAEKLLDPNGMTETVEFTFTEDGVSPSGLNVKGSTPKSGSMKITTDGKITLAITNGEVCITKDYDASEIETAEEFESCELGTGEMLEPVTEKSLSGIATTNDFATSVDACATSGTCVVGTRFALRVTDTEIQNFYVVSDIDNKVTLIMDRNIGSSVDWAYRCGEATGPIAAIEYLESQTTNWTNVPKFNYVYLDENEEKEYEDIMRNNIHARLLTHKEAENIISNYWAYENLDNLEGYWLTRSSGGYYAWGVFNDGSFKNGSDVDEEGTDMESQCGSSYNFGVRPVIEILK